MVGRATRVMVRILMVSLVLGATFVLGLLIHHGGARPVRAQMVDRAAVVQSFFDAANNGDVNGELALFTPNAFFIPTSMFQGVASCGPAAPCQGVTLCNLFQRQASSQLIRTLTEIQVSGSVVSGRFIESNEADRAAGRRDLTCFIADVPNDRISAFAVVLDVSDPETADVAVTQAQAPAVPASPACTGVGS